MDWSLDDLEIEEELAGGGSGPTGSGQEQEDRGRIRADDVYPKYWQSTHLSGNGRDTRVQADIACVTYTCTCTVTTAQKWY